MNDIQKVATTTKIKRITKKPYTAIKHFLSRGSLVWRLFVAVKNYREIELDIQKARQAVNDLKRPNVENEYHEAVGFLKGLEYCLKKRDEHKIEL